MFKHVCHFGGGVILVWLALQPCLARIRSVKGAYTSSLIYTACNGTKVMSSSNLGVISNDVNEVQFRRPHIWAVYMTRTVLSKDYLNYHLYLGAPIA